MTPIVLALDTSTRATAVAVRSGDLLEQAHLAPDGGRPAHAGALLGIADGLLDRIGASLSDVTTVAVCVGPGSFTGLRVGIATARGLASGAAAAVVGVGSLRALVEQARADGEDGPILAMIEGGRGELFVAGSAGRGQIDSPSSIPAGEIGTQLVDGVLCVGNGTVAIREQLIAAGGRVAELHEDSVAIPVAAIARLADDPDCSGEGVMPVYVREPDAVPGAGR